MIDAQPLKPPMNLTAFEAFRRFGFVPVMRGGAETATEAGQGAETNGNGLYQEALQGVDPSLHGVVEPILKQWDSQVTPKLQEAAELRKQYEGLSQVEGLSDVPAEELTALMEFRQVLQDPQALAQWVSQMGQILGVEGGGELSEEDWLAMGQQNGWFEDDGAQPQGQGLDANTIAQQVMEQLRGELDPLKQAVGSFEQNQLRAQETAALEQQYSKLEQDNGFGEEPPDSDAAKQRKQAVIALAHGFAANQSQDPLADAYQQFLAITGRAEGEAIDGKLGQPNGALTGGRPNTSPQPTSWHGGTSPKDIALARMRGA